MLRERREARGLTQEQAADRARVQLVFVRALEEDDYHLLPDELYLTRFVYEYAGSLGLDPSGAHEAFRRQTKRAPAHPPLYKPVPRVAILPWRRILWAAGAVLALAPLTFVVLSLAGREREAPVPPQGVAPPASRAAPPVFPEGRAATHRHVLVARAREVAWMAVRVDGEREQEVWLREGEMVRWGAQRGFLVTVGNPGAVELTLDGQPVSLAGQQGRVVRNLELPGPSPGREASPVPRGTARQPVSSPPGKTPSKISAEPRKKAITPPGPP
jgi:transcriptional regulator with XRE-family HTH domain